MLRSVQFSSVQCKASPPGRHQEQAPKQRCTFSSTAFSSRFGRQVSVKDIYHAMPCNPWPLDCAVLSDPLRSVLVVIYLPSVLFSSPCPSSLFPSLPSFPAGNSSLCANPHSHARVTTRDAARPQPQDSEDATGCWAADSLLPPPLSPFPPFPPAPSFLSATPGPDPAQRDGRINHKLPVFADIINASF